MKENKGIEQLFQKEFESFEIEPSKKVWRRIRTNLLIKKFFHFSPQNINIWYTLGAIIIFTGALFLISRPEEKNIKSPELQHFSKIILDSDSLVSKTNENIYLNQKNSVQSASDELVVNSGKDRDPNSKNNRRSKWMQDKESAISKLRAAFQNTPENKGDPESVDNMNYNGQSLMAWFECLTPEGCVPLRASFRNFSQNAVRYLWSFGDGGSSEVENPTYIFDEPGTWFVSLTAFSGNNEISIYTDSVKVSPLPKARFSMDTQGVPGDGHPVYFYNYSQGAENYFWDFGDGSNSVLKEPDHFFNKKGKTDIKLLVSSESGCLDSVIIKDAFKEGEPVFMFPTAFSPNINGAGTGQYALKDPSNSVFYPYVEEEPEEYQLRIFNRSGLQIFESTDIQIGWDGYYHEVLQPQGVYIWKARATFSDGRSVVKMGDVTLLWGEK